MECLIASTTSRLAGQWLFTGHVRDPLHPGACLVFREQSYLVAQDLTVKVPFAAKDPLEAREISREITDVVNTTGTAIDHSRRANVTAVFKALTQCDHAINRVCDAGLLGQTAGSSIFAAYLVDLQVKKSLPRLRSCVRVGDGVSTGYFDAHGNCHAHCWVEISDGTERWVADITADQFGGEAFTILPQSVAAGRYVPAGDELAREQISAIEARLNEKMPGDNVVYQGLLVDNLLMALLSGK